MKLTTEDRKVLQDAINVLSGMLQQVSPEVPERIEEWPEDDTHLRGDCWECSWGSIISYRDGGWHWWNRSDRVWRPETTPGSFPPLNRTTDPSLPRTWGTLDDVPEDVERVSGDYAGERRELARSGLCESGWFHRLKDGPFRGWMELSADRTRRVTNIKEDQ